MRFELQIITGDQARAKLRQIGSLTASAPAQALPPVAFIDGDSVLAPSALAEAEQIIAAPEPELGVHVTRDGLLVGFRFVVLDRRWLVWNRMEGAGGRTPNHLDPHLKSGGSADAVLDYDDEDVDYFGGQHLLLHWDAAYMYHHWMFECAPRLLLALNAEFLQHFKFAFPTDRPGFVDETLDLFGVPTERRVYYDPKRLTRFEVLGLTPVPVYERDACSVSVLNSLRCGMLEAAAVGSGLRPSKVLFTRRDAPNSERMLLNEDKVVRVLEAEGFVALEPGAMTIAEQVRTVNAAAIIVYLHGSAGANLVFAGAEAKILHVFPDVTYFFVSHGIGAAVTGARQAYLFGPSFQRRAKYHNSPWLVSPDRILSAIRRLEELG